MFNVGFWLIGQTHLGICSSVSIFKPSWLWLKASLLLETFLDWLLIRAENTLKQLEQPASLVAQLVKNPPAMQETPQFDSWVGKIPWRRERLPPPVFQPGELHGLYMGSQRVRHNWVNFTFTQFLKCLLINEAFSKIWSPIPTYTSIPLPCFVIKPKLILLATWQASKSRDELLGERMATYLESQKTKKMGDSCLQRTILPELEFRLLLY